MSKYEEYQEALKTAYEMMNTTDFGSAKIGCEALKVLTELVDKATPNKPYYLNYGGYQIGNWKCPSCDGIVAKDEYCKHCGQKLDWSDKDE